MQEHIYIYIYTHTHTRARAHTTHVHASLLYASVQTLLCTHTHSHTHTDTKHQAPSTAYTHIHTKLCRDRVHSNRMHVVYTHVHTYMYAHTHTHAHMQAKTGVAPTSLSSHSPHVAEPDNEDSESRHSHYAQQPHAPANSQQQTRHSTGQQQQPTVRFQNTEQVTQKRIPPSMDTSSRQMNGEPQSHSDGHMHVQQFHSGNIHDFKKYNMDQSLDILHPAQALEGLAGGVWVPGSASASVPLDAISASQV
jgi:hypothetical protein